MGLSLAPSLETPPTRLIADMCPRRGGWFRRGSQSLLWQLGGVGRPRGRTDCHLSRSLNLVAEKSSPGLVPAGRHILHLLRPVSNVRRQPDSCSQSQRRVWPFPRPSQAPSATAIPTSFLKSNLKRRPNATSPHWRLILCMKISRLVLPRPQSIQKGLGGAATCF